MKKTIYLILALCLVITKMTAKEINIPQGSIWSYFSYNLTIEYPIDFTRYIVDGEETIDNKVYKKIYRFKGCSYLPENSVYAGCFREENNKIYVPKKQFSHIDWLPRVNDEIILYDFSLNVGDSFQGANDATYNVSAIKTININGEQRKIITLNGDSSDTWIEGIGSISQDILSPLAPIKNGYGYTLNVFNNPNGQTIYRAPYIDGEEGKERLDTYKEDCMYKPQFIGEGTKWTEARYGGISGWRWIETNYEIKGNKTVDSYNYWQVYEDEDLIALMREDDQKNIYVRDWSRLNGNPTDEFLIYSFTKPWEAGDVIRYAILETEGITLYESTVGEISYVTLKNGETVPCVNGIIYSIGNETGIFEGISDQPTNGTHTCLSAYYRDGQLIYEDKKTNPDNVENIEIEKTLLIRNDVGTTTFTLPMESDGTTLYIYHTNGQQIGIYSMNKGTVEVSGLPVGIYVYLLKNMNTQSLERGKFTVRK